MDCERRFDQREWNADSAKLGGYRDRDRDQPRRLQQVGNGDGDCGDGDDPPNDLFRVGGMQSFDDCSQRDIAMQGDGAGDRKFHLCGDVDGKRGNGQWQRIVDCAQLDWIRDRDRDQQRGYEQVRNCDDLGGNANDSANDFFRGCELHGFDGDSQRNSSMHSDCAGDGKFQLDGHVDGERRHDQRQWIVYGAEFGGIGDGDRNQHGRYQ